MLFRRASLASLATASLATAAVFAVGGCDAGADTKSAAASGPSVIAPGRPGEANRTLSAQEAAGQRADDNSPNAADRSYATMMIEHHAQALEMTGLAPERARSAAVKRMAERISASQGPEIAAMKNWLRTDGESTGEGGEHDQGGTHDHAHMPMPGMATEAQLKQLKSAQGKAFDALFLTLMIAHHQGAITMATDVKARGHSVRIEEMADDVIAQQTAEISRMRALS
ncbi:DUF305 domain-containing protein [Streptomyces sp. LaPpAH-108]|uniref:DUF305 domain-containing protein n=1 Tax=Streptomyces sp. LaPpAH-108 TaxID=1155714 RepID=UPI00037944CB|nr:DUF305 domain-containing protein [Streptomyces sp. LaPpAH-108]